MLTTPHASHRLCSTPRVSSQGTVTVELYTQHAPRTCANFAGLARRRYYDGVAFHRIVPGFVIQGGDGEFGRVPNVDASQVGTGGPGYTIKAEFNSKHHARGVLSMARTSDPDSAGSQFFICHGDAGFLDGQYTVFGQLIKGDDVLEKIATTATEPPDRPIKRVNVESIKIVPADSVK